MSETEDRDDYVVPGLPETVLRNRHGITDPDVLSRYERQLARAAAEETLAIDPPERTFDRAHLSGLHERLFEDTYEWAGRMRDETFTLEDGTRIGPKETLGKGDNAFARASEIADRLDRMTDYIKSQDNFRDADPPRFVEGTAEVLAEVNDIHPFREGNGRAQREFVTDLAYEAGYELDFERIDGPRNIAASKSAAAGDMAPMQAMIRDASQPERRIMLAEAERALSSNPQHAWATGGDITTRTLPPAETVRGTLLETTERTAILVDEENALVVARREDMPGGALKMTEVKITGGETAQDRVWAGEARSAERTAEVVAFPSRGAPRAVEAAPEAPDEAGGSLEPSPDELDRARARATLTAYRDAVTDALERGVEPARDEDVQQVARATVERANANPTLARTLNALDDAELRRPLIQAQQEYAEAQERARGREADELDWDQEPD